jgi:hypothetical protein
MIPVRMTTSQLQRAGIGGKKKAPAHRPGEMNKTEAEYAQKLENRKLAGEIVRWEFEKITLKIGKDCRYTPDFFAVTIAGLIELHEVKGGYMRDDSVVKLVCAAEQFKCFKFYLAQKKKGTWTVKEIG